MANTRVVFMKDKKTHLKTVFPQLLHGVIMNAASLNYYKFS